MFVASFTATRNGPLPTVTEAVTELVSPKHTYRCAGAGVGRLPPDVPDRPGADGGVSTRVRDLKLLEN